LAAASVLWPALLVYALFIALGEFVFCRALWSFRKKSESTFSRPSSVAVLSTLLSLVVFSVVAIFADALTARITAVGVTLGAVAVVGLMPWSSPSGRRFRIGLPAPVVAVAIAWAYSENSTLLEQERQQAEHHERLTQKATSELERLAFCLENFRPQNQASHPSERLAAVQEFCPAVVALEFVPLSGLPANGWPSDRARLARQTAHLAAESGRSAAKPWSEGAVLVAGPPRSVRGVGTAAIAIVDPALFGAGWHGGAKLFAVDASPPNARSFSVGGTVWAVDAPVAPANHRMAWVLVALKAGVAGMAMAFGVRSVVARRRADEQSAELEAKAISATLERNNLEASVRQMSEANRLARVGVVEWFPHSGEAAWSETLAEILGRASDGTIATIRSAVAFAQQPEFDRRVSLVSLNRGREEFETKFLKPDGTEVAAAVGLCAVPGPELTLLASIQDITARKQAEAAVRASEEQFRRSFDSTAVSKALVRPDGSIFRVNAALCELLGYTSDELIARSLHRLTHPDDLYQDLAFVADCLAGKINGYELEKRYLRADGQIVWGLLSASTVRDATGRPDHFVCQIVDLTARKLAEYELLASETRLAAAQRIAGMGNWEWVPADNRVWWSDNLYRLVGLEPRDDAPGFDGFLNFVHPDDREMVRTRMAQADAGTEPYDFDFRIVRTDGELRWWHAEAVIERDNLGRPVLWRGTDLDVTERKIAEDARRSLDDRLRQTQKLESLGVLAGGIAHDFNNLLTGVLGNAALARECVPPESELHEFLRPIERAATHAAGLCQQMLAYAGKRPAVRGAFALTPMIEESKELLRLAASRKIDLIFNLEPILPACDGDAAQMRQVLLNLVSNASEAIGDRNGTITIRTGKCVVRESGGELAPGEYVWVEVADTGCGMEPDIAARIFDPFFTTKFTGRGLGLSAVHGIAKMHGGGVTLKTAPGRGTTFRVSLAAADAGLLRTPPPVYHTPVEIPPPTPRTLPFAGQELAIVADDDVSVRQLAAFTLRGLGFNVIEVESGKAAVDLVQSRGGEVKLVVLDMLMPEMDGREAAARIRGLVAALPIVVMSGYAGADVTKQFGPGEVSAYVQKPFRPADLTNCVRGVIAKATRKTAGG
jgi:two-component system, cell cycle sensor histidine kinase and response regulator CckA